ncbi:MAG: family 1 glycosylhydrolase [Candidatus Bathycorpusculaceae bacterium]
MGFPEKFSWGVPAGFVSGDLPENGIAYWNFYEEDHDLARRLVLNAYRIGIEWSRIFPKSTRAVDVGVEGASDGKISKIEMDDEAVEELEKASDKEALNHYGAVINDLRMNGFEVFVCLNHFTLPLWIHNPIVDRDTRLRNNLGGGLRRQQWVRMPA